MSANIVPPFSEGTSFACNMASSGSAFSNVESVCHAVARLTPYQSISPVSSTLVSQEISGQSTWRYFVSAWGRGTPKRRPKAASSGAPRS